MSLRTEITATANGPMMGTQLLGVNHFRLEKSGTYSKDGWWAETDLGFLSM
jgi:hypothetical protein